MANVYNRYTEFNRGGHNQIVPKITLPIIDSDLRLVFDKNTMRMDMLSYKYYGDANYGWLIMMANPSVGSLEFMIPDGSILRIPYPLDSALKRYETEVDKCLKVK